jgi:hypothetical protein
MKKSFLLLLIAVVLGGCSSAPRLTLSQIQPNRVFALSKETVFETIRFCAIKQEIRIQSQEFESGRVIGYRTYTYRDLPEPKMIIMKLKITPIDPAHTEVQASFTFSKMADALTREEENMLVDEYVTLFDYLERKAN